MSDAPAYMIANFVITDADKYRNYEKGFFPLLQKYDGEFFTFDDNPTTLEGDARLGRMVMFKFPSEEKAQAWYADPDYRALCEHRREGTDMQFLTLVHGLPPRA
jgi:uncharacterized protein (DUF1330 family)